DAVPPPAEQRGPGNADRPLLGAVRVVRPAEQAWRGRVEDQPADALGKLRREEQRHGAAVRFAEYGRALAADGVHDRAYVVDPLLQSAGSRHGIGQPGAALVEDDHP